MTYVEKLMLGAAILFFALAGVMTFDGAKPKGGPVTQVAAGMARGR